MRTAALSGCVGGRPEPAQPPTAGRMWAAAAERPGLVLQPAGGPSPCDLKPRARWFATTVYSSRVATLLRKMVSCPAHAKPSVAPGKVTASCWWPAEDPHRGGGLGRDAGATASLQAAEAALRGVQERPAPSEPPGGRMGRCPPHTGRRPCQTGCASHAQSSEGGATRSTSPSSRSQSTHLGVEGEPPSWAPAEAGAGGHGELPKLRWGAVLQRGWTAPSTS